MLLLINICIIKFIIRHSKKTKKKESIIKRQEKITKKKHKQNEDIDPLFPAIDVLIIIFQLINDPQGLVEKLYEQLKRVLYKYYQKSLSFEVRLLYLNLLSQIIGRHKVIFLPFYGYIVNYLSPHQQHITSILAAVIQTCHDLIPPEELVPCVKTIANAFITDKTSTDAISVGMNAIREIMARTPLLLEEEELQALIQEFVLLFNFIVGNEKL